MIAVSLKNNEFKDCTSDVVITDKISGYIELSNRVRKIGIFEKVIELQVKNTFTDNKIEAFKNRFFGIKENFEDKYDFYLFANLDHSASAVYGLLKRKNSNIHIYMFEDGLASYSNWYTEFLSMYGAKSKAGKIYKKNKIKILYHLIVDDVFEKVERMYLLLPEIITYLPNFEIVKMRPIAYNDEDVVNQYNQIFGYDDSVDAYDKKVIFFEESYYADGIETNDVEILGKIAEIIGKENIFVKIHPRNPDNRFKVLGYKTNVNTSIPWEVIAMNIDLKDKILCSIASVAVIEPCIMLAKDYIGLFMMNTIGNKSFLKENITDLYREICKANKDVIMVPYQMEEVRNILCTKKK